MDKRYSPIYRFEPRWSDRVAWYGSALAATALCWCIWWLSPVMHQDPFVIFILALSSSPVFLASDLERSALSVRQSFWITLFLVPRVVSQYRAWNSNALG